MSRSFFQVLAEHFVLQPVEIEAVEHLDIMDSAVLAIAKHLEDSCADVREATMNALRALDPVECSILTAALVKRITHHDSSIRLASVKALALVVEPGNAVALDAITRLLDDADAGVRWATVEAMGRIAVPGSMTDLAVEAIAQRMTMGNISFKDKLECDGSRNFPPHRPWTSHTLSIHDLQTLDTMIIKKFDADTTLTMIANQDVDTTESTNVNKEGADVWWSALEAMARISVPDSANTIGEITERLQHETCPQMAVPRHGQLNASGEDPLLVSRSSSRNLSMSQLKGMDTIQEEDDMHSERRRAVYT